MSSAIEGAVLIGVAGALTGGALGVFGAVVEGALQSSSVMAAIIGFGASGVAMEAGAVAAALTRSNGIPITTRESAAPRQYVYGQQKVGGILIFESTTGSSKRQYNQVIALAAHECDSIQSLWLDGRMVFFTGSGTGNVTRNGVNFGGNAGGGNHPGPTGEYNFDGLVYCEARFGDQLSGDVMGSLTANDGSWSAYGGKSPWVGGCTYIYLKCEGEASQFPQQPGIRATINGLNTILDPRTGATGFTNNWALCLADFLTNTEYGLGDKVNTAQLIAAANVCDEAIALAAGGSEAQYTCNYRWDSSMAPGSVIDAILAGAGGRISYVGGEWMIYPAYWQGPCGDLNESALTSSAQWKPYRSVRELANRVTGTYIAPTYPYSSTVTPGVPKTSNLYDGNGFYNGINEGVTNSTLDWQQTDFPMYAMDALHGYPSDEWLNADGGIERPIDLPLASVCSVGQAQRVAKIALMRNRQQSSGTFEFGLSAYALQPTDVFQFTDPSAGWTGKLLEVTSTSFAVKDGDGEGDAPSIRYTLNVQECDPSVYEWSTTEELTAYDVPANPAQTPAIPVPPTDMQLTSGVATAIVQPDGSVQAVIEVTFNTPQDPAATQIQVQYQQAGATTWLSAPSIDISLNSGLITNVIAGAVYNVQIRTARANGAVSNWVQIFNYQVATTPTYLGTLATQIPTITANAASAAIAPGEMLVNSNFLAPTLAAWATYYGTQPSVSTAEFRTGNQSLQLLNQGVNQSVAVTAGRTYLLQMWVMSNGQVSGLGARLAVSAGTVTILSQNGVDVSVFGNEVVSTGPAIPWTDLQMVFTVSQSCTLTVNVANSIGAQIETGTGWVDNVSLTDVTNTQAVVGGTPASLITPISAIMTTSSSGASIVAPTVYAGSGESIVPNGTFSLGSAYGWAIVGGFNFSTDSAGPNLYTPANTPSSAFSPMFSVIPGQKYRLNFSAACSASGGGVYLRIGYQAALGANWNANTNTYTDFISNGSVTTTLTTYSYDWVCPAGMYYASMCLYTVAVSDLICRGVSCIPYQAVSEWGADRTSNQQSATTASLANQSLDNLPDGTTYIRPTHVSTGGIYKVSTPFIHQGGLVQTISSGIFSSTVNNSSIEVWCAGESLPFPDGSFVAVPATGSSGAPAWSFTGLAASTTYYVSGYFDMGSGTVQVVMSDVNGGKSAPSVTQQIQVINGDQHLALVVGWAITTGSTTTSTGGGGGVPDPTCPADDQIMETLELGFVEARSIEAGMHVRDVDDSIGWNLVHAAHSVQAPLHHVTIAVGDETESYHVDLNHRWLRPGGDAMAEETSSDWVRSADLGEGGFVLGADGLAYQIVAISEPHPGMYRKLRCDRQRMRMGKLVAHNWMTKS